MTGRDEVPRVRGRRVPWVWGASAAEVAARYACDRLVDPIPGAREGESWAVDGRDGRDGRDGVKAGPERLVRAIGVAAPVGTVWAWLGNLRLAPYSYDWLDNLGRRSPRTLAHHLGPLEPGQRVMTIFTVIDVHPGSELTIRTREGLGTRLFGQVWVSYRVVPVPPGRSRLIAVLRLGGGPGLLSRWRARALAWGDLLMMRRQLRTLRDLAEATPR
ncbi:SRPBCC family protein [uncultured Serinicoccus sp.]|uniref:SRPBCC family protein n=1 Tax=uncultured Serinicoccus sp. TaxID=735514 RepID=UPI002615B293|nr:SRPBCC family protein [uncultured Serinicoccus sp.]